jgi:hypothetical protein
LGFQEFDQHGTNVKQNPAVAKLRRGARVPPPLDEDRGPVVSGLFPSYHTARRVLVACGDADRLIQSRRFQAMAIAPTPISPYRSVDIHGRALPLTEEEILERNAEAIRALDEVAEMGDEEEQRATLEALMTAIDEEPLSARRRFR